ncbi:MAG TPA: hypothetical protein VHQ64_00855 [Pyrinomonadaceae bacterium]|jgi:hypothetical protein|nr:hypothetical protein [Pyrinomonadaceae bacterium]
MLKWLRLSYAFERIALNVFDELNNAEGFLAILLNPPGKIVESELIKFQACHGLPQAEFRFRALLKSWCASMLNRKAGRSPPLK